MTDHTPEPWQTIGGRKDRAIIGSKRSIARVWGAIQPDDRPNHEEADANAARIVACVNACAGIPTEQLQPESFAQLRRAASCADEAINPKDRAALSMHEWNKRLKAATRLLRAALAPFRED